MNTIKSHSPDFIQWHSLIRTMPRWADESPEMAALVADIQERGIDQPLIVCRTDDGAEVPGDFFLLDGRHRHRAAILAGLTQVPIIERDESEALGIVLGSITQRRHFSKGALAYLCYPVIEAAAVPKENYLKKGPKSIQSTTGNVEELCARSGFSRDLYFQARKVHEAFARRPDLREEYEPRILSGEMGLGACVAGLAGKESTEGAKRQDRPPEQLLFDGFAAISVRFRAWDKLEGSTRRAVADRAVETILALPDEVQDSLLRALRAARKDTRK
jgi:hypothetical protein